MRHFIVLIIISSFLFSSEAEPLYSSCKFCHGVKAEKIYANMVPRINSLDIDTLELKLRLYKEGKVDEYGFGEIMTQQMKNIPDDRISQLAKYIKSLENKD